MEIDIIEEDIKSLDIKLLELLLVDRSTNKNIVWATTDYNKLGESYAPECEIKTEQITGLNTGIIRPRVTKAKDKQSNRTRDKAEVFTPSWICNAQNNLVDEQWFGREDVFILRQIRNGRLTKARSCFLQSLKRHGRIMFVLKEWRLPVERHPTL